MKQKLMILEQYMFSFFSRFLLTKQLIKRLRMRYEIYYPGDAARTKALSARLMAAVSVCALSLCAALFMTHPSLTCGILTCFYVWLIFNEAVRLSLSLLERKLLKQFEMFLLDVRHQYYTTHSVSEAVLEAISCTGKIMQIHGNLLYEILISVNVKEKAQQYHHSMNNTFLKLFLTQCVNAMEYGDQNMSGESLYVTNLGDLRHDIQNKILQLDAFRYAFSGLVAVSVLPLLALSPIKRWGMGNLPELDGFYNGRTGTILIPVFFLLTFLAYLFILNMQEVTSQEMKSHPVLFRLTGNALVKNFLAIYERKYYSRMEARRTMLRRMGETLTAEMLQLQQMLCSIVFLLIGLALLLCAQWNDKQMILHDFSSFTVTAGRDTENQNEIKNVVEACLAEYAEALPEKHSEIEIEEKLQQNRMIFSTGTVKSAVQEISDRLDAYQDSYITWQEVLVLLAAAGLAYFMPLILLLFRRRLRDMTMNLEVMQFQSILMMLVHMPEMTVLTLLETLEEFAHVFRSALQDCINDYSVSREEALAELKNKEKFEPFCQLVDNFIICDRIGIEKAFDEVEHDRMHFQERQELEIRKQLKDKSLLGRIIAYTPCLLILTGYLILPFSAECIRQFIESWQDMQAL